MLDIDNFITLLYENISENVTIEKQMDGDNSIFIIQIFSDVDNTTSSTNTGSTNTTGTINVSNIKSYHSVSSVTMNQKNSSINISYNFDSVTVFNKDIVKKWLSIFEEYCNTHVNKKAELIISAILKTNKSLNRDYKLNKIVNESL